MTEEDKIIYHDFTPKPKQETGTEPEAKLEAKHSAGENTLIPQPEDLPKGKIDLKAISRLIESLGFGNIMEKTDVFAATMKKLKEMNDFLKSLRSTTTADTISLREDLISGMSFKQMCTVINNSTPSDWKKSPSYYKALALKFSPLNLTNIIQLGMDNKDKE